MQEFLSTLDTLCSQMKNCSIHYKLYTEYIRKMGGGEYAIFMQNSAILPILFIFERFISYSST